WDDYRTWSDTKRWELLAGQAYAMSPSPSCEHQDIVLSLGTKIKNALIGKTCTTFIAPMDVKLSEEDVVQPDLLVVCDPKQIKQYIEGAPALIIEILSPSSLRHDRMVKTALYAKFGIKEYWIVTPFPCMVEIYLLQGEHYALWNTFGNEDTLTSPSFPDLQIDLNDVFAFTLEQHAEEMAVVNESPATYVVCQ
ncbi:MAG: Uma2 family endonuclease, partial [Spartobacteria bacterium]|nr:Uma2 family endonuclease [Spartobacteria bacterium]